MKEQLEGLIEKYQSEKRCLEHQLQLLNDIIDDLVWIVDDNFEQ